MIKIIKNYLAERKRKKYLIQSAIERKKINFVYRYLLNNYEKSIENKVDIPAFMYASKDMKQIIRERKINQAYDNAKKILEEEFKKKDIDLELKEQTEYDANWAELQAEMNEALLWGV